jgi:two-component system response regulator HydG/two-component system response regulator AtoC
MIKTDFRLVSATNKDLRELIRQKLFRDDLYFRINGHEIYLPPLRERKADIPLLADHFLRRFCEDNGYPLPRIAPEFTSVIMGHAWDGNIRGLRNYVEQCAVLSRGPVLRPVIQPNDLGVEPPSGDRLPRTKVRGSTASTTTSPRELRSEVREHERAIILQALESSGWNQRRAAADLQLSEATLRNKMLRFEISPPTGFKPKRGRPKTPKN